ncbi:MAG: 30S ribosomal protein S8 [Planctomycetes bacterium]|nr:30S ribosomal protein S8 [Planctomycetota bacterium]
MSMTDPVADLLTRIRNANSNGVRTVSAPYSSIKKDILRVLKEQGYIVDYQPVMEGTKGLLRVELKYGPDGEKVIQRIQRVSRPGRRCFSKSQDLPDVLGGLGVAVVSTSRGVMSNLEAKRLGVGGEVICEVW